MLDDSAMRRLLGPLAALCLLAGSPHAAELTKPGYQARALDRQGKLAEAIPIYQARAEQTQSTSDRLRYAGALLRAGKMPEARQVYAGLMVEGASVYHGGDPVPSNVGVCASSALLNGFPVLAVEYLRPAFRANPRDVGAGLLLVRSLLAAGDVDGAREVLRQLPKETGSLVIGQRIELARAYFLAGDVDWARRLLDEKIEESVGQMMRESILTNVDFKKADWPKVASALADAKRKVPSSVTESCVDRAWRNLQREMRSVLLRRAIALWNQDKREDAVEEASPAQEADEEYIRSGAILLVAAGKLADGRRDDAVARLKALAGHDVRFAEPVGKLEATLAKGGDPADALSGFETVLSGEDRAQDFVTKPLLAVLAGAVKSGKPRVESAAR